MQISYPWNMGNAQEGDLKDSNIPTPKYTQIQDMCKYA